VELTRRNFLITTMMGAASTAALAHMEESSEGTTELPEGVILPYQWEDDSIPSSGSGSPGTDPIDEAVTQAMREYGIVGCGIALVRGESVIYSKGFGYAELPDTPFLATTASRCGSLAKPVTALSALLLADEGKLDLDAEVLPILKEADIVPQPVGSDEMDERISGIKVRHLMDHTSGLPGWTTYTAWRANRNVAVLHHLKHTATARDVVSDGLGSAKLDSEPGERFQYANANFVILARVIEAKSGMPFNKFLTHKAMPKFGVKPNEIYVSRNQVHPRSRERGKNEATYYQTSAERYVSFVPADQSKGRVFGEAYRGYATEASDGGGGIACVTVGLGRILANLHSEKPALSKTSLSELLTPPSHYTKDPDFDPASSPYYSKGFWVRFSGGRPWFSHGGMTNHCGGVIGHNAGYQWAVVSNWNNAQSPYVDSILARALTEVVSKLG
jgi:CubicO group peptidase (beta-lactamase class C family)